VQHGAKSESSGIEIDKYEPAKCCCMVCVEIECFEYLNLTTRVCRENCEIHEMREIREEHGVKSSKQSEGVVLMRVPRLSLKSLRIE
jgi:hypothetical protein